MSISFSTECFRTKASRNFTVQDAGLITEEFLSQIIQSAHSLQAACQVNNQAVPCPEECQIARLALADLETLKSLFLDSTA